MSELSFKIMLQEMSAHKAKISQRIDNNFDTIIEHIAKYVFLIDKNNNKVYLDTISKYILPLSGIRIKRSNKIPTAKFYYDCFWGQTFDNNDNTIKTITMYVELSVFDKKYSKIKKRNINMELLVKELQKFFTEISKELHKQSITKEFIKTNLDSIIEKSQSV